MATRAGVAYVDIQGDWAGFNRDFARKGAVIGRNAGKLGSQIGSQLTRAASLSVKAGAVGVGAGLVYAVKKAADFEGQISSLGAVTDANANAMERFRKQALKAGADTKYSALQAAQAQTELAKGGLSVSQIMRGGLKASLALAAAGELELADAAEYTVNAIKLFGLSGKDAMKVADGLATAANSTTADVSDFGIALKMGGSAAKAAGLDFGETTAALEALAEIGIKGCYDGATDVLTRDGFKAWDSVIASDEFATINPATGAIEYQAATKLIRYRHTGPMYRVASKHVDLFVTPEHRMWVRRVGQDSFDIARAEDLGTTPVEYQTGEMLWEGEDVATITLPEVIQDRGRYTKQLPAREIDSSVWAEFLGYFLADGSTDWGAHGYRVTLHQHKPGHLAAIRECLTALGVNFCQTDTGFAFTDEQVYRTLEPLGKQPERYIPAEAKNWSPGLLRILFDAFAAGDGDAQGNLYTCSARLRDDLAEVALKLGLAAKTLLKHPAGHQSVIRGRTITARHDQWIVRTSSKQSTPAVRDISRLGPAHAARIDGTRRAASVVWEDYDGDVFCAEVPNGLLIVRRSGCIVVSGNSDAGTSLKATLAHLVQPSSVKVAKDLGIELFDAKGNMKNLTVVAGELREGLGGLTREQRLQAAIQLAGTDGMRAVLALYDAGPKKIAQFQRELSKQGTAAEVAKRKQDNLKGSLEQLGGSVETLGIQVGTAMIPMIRKGADEITDFANKVGKVVGRDDLSLGEKLSKSFAMAKVEAGPLVDKIDAAIDRADLPAKLAAGISVAIPVIAGAAAKAAPKAVEAFAHAFAASSTWGKLAIGAVALKKIGGLGALGIGSSRGATPATPLFVKDISVGPGGGPGSGPVVAPVGGRGGVGGKLKGLAKGAGKFGGYLAAADFAINLVDTHGNPISAVANTAHDLTFGILPKIDPQGAAKRNLSEFQQKIQGLAASGNVAGLQAIRKELDSYSKFDAPGGIQQARRDLDALLQSAKQNQALRNFTRDVSTTDPVLKRYGASLTSARDKLRGLKHGSGEYAAAAQQVKDAQKHVNNRLLQMLPISQDAKKEVRSLGINFAGLGDTVNESASYIAAATNMVLAGLGAATIKFSLKRSKKIDASFGDRAPAAGHQRGGQIYGGKPIGDSIPAVLERGEYVINRNAVAKVGRDALDRLNFGQAPRFQKGGIVPIPGMPGESIHSSILPDVMALIRRYKLFITDGYAPTGHKAGGEHPKGLAIDGVPGRGGSWNLVDKLAQWAEPSQNNPRAPFRWVGYDGDSGHGRGNHIHLSWGGAGGGIMGAIAKIVAPGIEGPDGPMKDIATGAAKTMTKAANRMLSSLSPAGTPGETESAGTGSGTALMRSISKARGWNFQDWWKLDEGETGHGANLNNPTSSARLRGQFLSMNYGKYGPGSDPAQNPSMDQQIQSMADYISERYGNPTTAYHKWLSRSPHWYSKGGLVGMAGGGLAKRITGTLKKVRAGRTPKVRKEAVTALVDRIKTIGLPSELAANLARHAGDANKFGEYADRAGQLTIEPTTEDGEPILGLVGGKNQTEWLTAQLGALFQWRNTIIDAEKITVEKRDETTRLIGQARKKLTAVGETIRAETKRRKRLAKRLERVRGRIERLRKHPRRHAALLARLRSEAGELRGQVIGIDGEQRTRTRVQTALKDRILPALTDKRTGLNTARGELLANLSDVQGDAAPMERLVTLPEEGVLGGQIFAVQMRLRELTDKPPKVTDSSTQQDDGGRADLLAQLLREANLRTAVSERAFDVFKDSPIAGSFGGGGVVPGPVGAPRIIEAHGREGVFTPEQMSALGAGNGGDVHLHFAPGTEWLRDFVTVTVGQETRRQARPASRALPGRGGGGIR